MELLNHRGHFDNGAKAAGASGVEEAMCVFEKNIVFSFSGRFLVYFIMIFGVENFLQNSKIFIFQYENEYEKHCKFFVKLCTSTAYCRSLNSTKIISSKDIIYVAHMALLSNKSALTPYNRDLTSDITHPKSLYIVKGKEYKQHKRFTSLFPLGDTLTHGLVPTPLHNPNNCNHGNNGPPSPDQNGDTGQFSE